MEEWKIINGYPYYEVSNFGNVRSYKNRTIISEKPHLLSPRVDHKGYYFVNLYIDHKMKSIKVHRLVAIAFIPNPNNLPQVNHKDENKLNNSAENLEWCDSKYNVNYGTGRQRSSKSREHCCIKPIIQYTLNGEFIQEFFSVTEASRVLHISLSSIVDCLKGRTSRSRNFKFKYK